MMLFLLALSMIVAMIFATIILMIEERAVHRMKEQEPGFNLLSVRRIASRDH